MRLVPAQGNQLEPGAGEVAPLGERLSRVAPPPPEQPGRERQEDLVDQPGRQQLGEQAGAAFAEDAAVSVTSQRSD